MSDNIVYIDTQSLFPPYSSVIPSSGALYRHYSLLSTSAMLADSHSSHCLVIHADTQVLLPVPVASVPSLRFAKTDQTSVDVLKHVVRA